MSRESMFGTAGIFKMAAHFSVEEVRDVVMNSEDDEPEEEVKIEEDSVDSAVDAWFDSFPATEGFNWELFKDLGKDVMKPLVKQCSVSCDFGELQLTERSKAAKVLCTTSINVASILNSESMLWLQRINGRLGGRVAFKRPYHGSISRSIPYGVFKAARRVISENRDGSFYEPRCYIRSNNKVEVIAFTSSYSLQKFFSIVSALSVEDVKLYFSKKLKSRGREDHLVKLLVDNDKQFSFNYSVKRGELTVSFQYGEWNSANYPLHNCQFDPDNL